MKIIYIATSPLPSNSRAKKEIYAFIKAGYRVVCIGWDRSHDGLVEKKYVPCFDTEVLYYSISTKSKVGAGFGNIVPLLKFSRKLKQFLPQILEKNDIVHACDLDTGLAASSVCSKHKIKFVYDIYDYYAASRRSLKRIAPLVSRLENKVINKADLTIICTEKRAEQIKGASPKKLIAIHNSPFLYGIEEIDTVKPGKDNEVCYIGSFVPNRYIVEMAEAISENSDIELVIGGFGKREIETRIKDLANSNENIDYLGQTPYEKTLATESSSAIMTALYDPAISNHRYCAPNKFYEALLLGKPLVAVKGTWIDEIIEEYDLGIVLSGNSKTFKKEFIEAVKELSRKLKDGENYRDRANKIYQANYSWEEMERRLIDSYKKL